MRHSFALGMVIVGAGCLADQRTVQPLFTEEDCVTEPAIVGTWSSDDGGPLVLEIRTLDDGYVLTTQEKGKPTRPLAIRLGRIAGTLYWDATAGPGGDDEDLRDQHLLPLHSIARLRVQDDRLVVAPLRSDWIAQALAQGILDTPQLELGGDRVLMGSTAQLQQLLLEHGGDDGAFAEEPAACGASCTTSSSDALVLHRVGR